MDPTKDSDPTSSPSVALEAIGRLRLWQEVVTNLEAGSFGGGSSELVARGLRAKDARVALVEWRGVVLLTVSTASFNSGGEKSGL